MIHAKGFSMTDSTYSYQAMVPEQYSKIRVGLKSLDGASLNLGSIPQALPQCRYSQKGTILKAIAENNIVEQRNISKFYYNTNGIYKILCDYLAYLYRYDWCVMCDKHDEKVKEETILQDFDRILQFLDNSYIRKLCGDIALSVIIEGVYYGYIVPSSQGLVLQQLPPNFCRVRYNIGNLPAVEFNMKYFDTFKDPAYRMKVINLFPKEFSKGYVLYKQNKLVSDNGDGQNGWYLLEPNNCVKFNLHGCDSPLFINAIPALIDLDAAQDLDRRKQMQKLLKIIVQKLPMDKNGDLIFDIDEAKDIHNNAVQMLRNAVGVDVLTTFADIDSVDMSDKNTSTTTDDLAKIERTVFNAFGISQNLFNTDGNLALNQSVLNDESSMRNLLFQFEIFYNRIVDALNIRRKKYSFKFYMLETTQYNYKELSKMYKEQTQLGFSKLLPQIALGHSQSFILNSIHFENEVLHLSEIMIPPLMSSTMSGEDMIALSKEATGRPETPDNEKSEKTIQNKESMN